MKKITQNSAIKMQVKSKKIHHLKIDLKSNSNIFNQFKNPREEETKKNAEIGDNYSYNSYSSL